MLRKSSKTLKYHTGCEVDHICVWSQSLKKLRRKILLASSLPFLLHLVLSGLIWSRRSEVRPYGDELMLIMWHNIWCVWSVCGQWGWPFDQQLTWWFLRFKETRSRRTGRKNTWNYFGVSRGQNNRRKSPFVLLLCVRNPFSSKLCFVFLSLSVFHAECCGFSSPDIPSRVGLFFTYVL